MKKLILIFLLILVPLVSADWFEVNSNYLEMNEIEEIIHIDGRDLYKSIGIGFLFKKSEKNNYKPENFTFYLTPERPTQSFPIKAEITNFKVCTGGIGGHSYDKIMPDCVKNLPFIELPRKYSTSNWEYTIDLTKIDFNTEIVINIEYNIPKFLKRGVEKKLILETICRCSNYEGNKCPPPKMMDKHIILPGYAIKIKYPEKAEYQPRDEGTRITLNDFTQNKPNNQYAIFEISYTDENAQLFRDIFNGSFIGLLTGVLSGLIIYLWLNKKDNTFIKGSILSLLRKISEIENKLNEFKSKKKKNKRK